MEGRIERKVGDTTGPVRLPSEDGAVLRVEDVRVSSSYDGLCVAVGGNGFGECRSLTDKIRVQL